MNGRMENPTDTKNAMNNTLNRYDRSKEKPMHLITKTTSVAMLVTLGLALAARAAEPPKPGSPVDLDKLVGQPADLAPWAYAWRADRQVQEKPEAYFIPRRLAHLEKTYRKADTEPTIQIGPDKWVKFDQAKYVKSPAQGPMTPPPKGVLHAGLLWETHVLWNRIELHWPKDKGPAPNPDAVEVRFHPNAAWFGVEWDRVAGKPEVSADGLTWTYSVKTAVVPDSMKAMGSTFHRTGGRGLAAGMVVVYVDPQGAPAGGRYAVPDIRVVSLKDWKRMDLEIEWGFQAGTQKSDYSGRIEGYLGIAGNVAPLAGDAETRVTGSGSWTSTSASGGRRGIKCSVLYLPWGMNDKQKEPGGHHQTAVTVWSKGGNFTFLPEDLEAGPILSPEYGFYVTKAGGGKGAREFATELAAKGLKGIRQRTREHREATTEEAIREVTMTKAPAGVTELPPMKEVEEPAMQVRTPEEWWNKAWRKGVYQLKKGPYSYYFGKEAASPIQALDLAGLHELAGGPGKLGRWLKMPGIKVESDCLDGDGNFHSDLGSFADRWDWTTGAGTTGYFLSIMGAHYLLSGDKEWFQKHQPRMQKAADWIIRQRTEYMKEVPNRGQLRSAGLQPPASLGESWGRNEWRFFYLNDRWSCDGILCFGRAISDFDPQKGKAYVEEARRYQEDIRKSVEQTIALTPVQKVLNGAYRSYSPGCCYYRREFTSWGWVGCRYGLEDQWHLTGLQGSPTLGSRNDPRHEGHLEVFQDRYMNQHKALERGFFAAREKKGLSVEENWFWGGISVQPGWFWLSDDELYRDDVSNFLRLLVDTYWHSTQPGDGEYYLKEGGTGQNWIPRSRWDCNSNSMGWFIRNFRNLLVMEDLDEEPWRLWLGRATPRHWLEQGKKISVKNAPTYFGTVAYEIVSDVDNGKITATVEMPARKAPKEVILRFRHPKAAPIKGVTVNGKPWTEFNKDKETIALKGLTGTVAVTAQY